MADFDTHSSSSSDGGGDVFLSPRSSVASKRSVQSVPTVREDGADRQPETEPRSTASRRETWIGEGLIDASGLEAIDRLSDVAYADLVQQSVAVTRDAPSTDAAAVDAKAPKLSEFLNATYPAEGDTPKQSTQRRRKLLDFLANDVGERYLNGVYKDEERAAGDDETGLDGLVSDDDEPKFQHAEDLHTLSSRSARANSRLLAFLAHEKKGKRHNCDGSQSFSSVHSAPVSSEPRNKFVTKVVPQKARVVLLNPGDVDSTQLSQMVAEEAERKQKARVDKELARQKVRQFLLEEEREAAKRKGSGNEATIKSVDESTVRRETVVDDYGKVNLLDYLDRVVDDGRSRSVPSEMDESGPPSNTSSPRSLASSLEADTNTSFTQGPDDGVAPPTPSTLSGMGNRFAQFLHRGGAANGHDEESNTPRARRLLPPSPFHSKGSNEKMSLEAAFHASKPPESPAPLVYGATTARMTPLLATLDQISHTCQKTELSEVSIARISTLLTSINQIVRDDVQKHRGHPNRVVRRLSGAHWVKSEQELHEHEKPHRPPVPKPAAEIPREPAPVVSASATVDNAKVKAGPGVLNAFKSFDAAQNLIETLSSFNKLLTECGLSGVKVDEPWRVYNHIKAGVYSKLGFRHKQLFKLLDARFNLDVYKRKPAAKKRVCIIGAGPVGLRAAVETALLGGQVVVLEKRKHFSRENILHLWPWVVQDLTALGAKVFFPSFCHSTAYFHVGTRQLQVILLKVALLVGVTVYSSTAFESVVAPNAEESDNKPFYTVATQPQIPWMEFTAVLGASGTNDKLAEPAGINRFVFSRKEALGIVCYFPNLGTTEEKKVTEFSWTIQFKQQMFAKMREIGVDLENIVYYRGEMHYLVMTPKRQNLLEQKVLKENRPEPQDLVQDDNINKSTLHEYVKRVVSFLGISKKAEFSRIRMFDFSTRTRADKAASILTAQGKKLYVGLIGDSLIEPFWPEGVGTCRGFLGALDGVWMVAQIGKKADEQLLADREMAYRVIQHVSGFRRDDLQKNVRKYTVDPKSRYTVKFPQLC
ncbi:hypothetical protein PRNP1_004240 [Phytophthora ramorum]